MKRRSKYRSAWRIWAPGPAVWEKSTIRRMAYMIPMNRTRHKQMHTIFPLQPFNKCTVLYTSKQLENCMWYTHTLLYFNKYDRTRTLVVYQLVIYQRQYKTNVCYTYFVRCALAQREEDRSDANVLLCGTILSSKTALWIKDSYQ